VPGKIRDRLGLTEEEERSIALDLFREWRMTSIQALSDEAGPEAAIRHMNPYNINSAMALSQNIPQLLNIDKRNAETAALTLSVVGNCMFKKTYHRVGIGKGDIRATSDDCYTKGNSSITCKMCDIVGKAYSNSFCSSVDYSMTSSMGSGDRTCGWHFKDKQMIDDEDRSERVVPDIILPDGLKNELSLALLGEGWINSIRAYVDFTGSEKTIENLGPYMRISGLSIGIRLMDQYKIGNDLESLKYIVKMIERMHHINGNFTESPVSLECEVDDCPFSDGPMELCHQYSSFFNGILDAINPEYEFAYDKMMTKGDKTCHWVIRKKDQNKTNPNEEVLNSQDHEEMIRTLKWRLVKGEITKKEYEDLEELIRK
jgi:predicted hydrocarbon binding protein